VRGDDYLDMEAYLGGAFLHPGGVRATQAMFERLQLAPGRRVLEIGCGTGATTALVGRLTGALIVALDRSPRMLAVAQRRLRQNSALPDIDLVRVNLDRGLPFSDGAFDAVFAESVIALLEDVEGVAGECFRVLKPGGRLAFNERIWKPGVPQPLVDEINGFSRRAFGIQSATRQPLDHAGWVRLLESAGLINVEAVPVGQLKPITPSMPTTVSRFQRRLRYLRRPSTIAHALRFKRLARQHPDWWAQQENYLFLAQKPDARPDD
jgi:SAM-dependent methyltransferase